MKNKTDKHPDDFNLFLASDTVLGALASIFEMTAEVPARGQERMLWLNALTGLARSGRNAAREMNVFLYKASDTHRFPSTYDELESDADEDGFVRDTPGIYLVSSR